MLQLLSAIFGALALLFVAATPAFAITFTIDGAPASVGENDPFSVTTNLTIASSAGNDYYLRATFAHPDTPSSYFGYTKNHFDTWYNGTPTIDFTQYKKVTMNEFNTWSGVVEIKVDSASSSYKGSGLYNLQLRYYTAAGNLSSNKSNLVQLNITAAATPTPTPSPTPVPSPTPTSTPTASPTLTPTSTPKPSPTSSSATSTTSKTPTPTASPKPTGVGAKLTGGSKKSDTNLVLGVQENPVVEGTESGASTIEEGSDQGKKPFLAIGLIALGTVFLGIAGYAFLRERSSGRIKDLDEKIS